MVSGGEALDITEAQSHESSNMNGDVPCAGDRLNDTFVLGQRLRQEHHYKAYAVMEQSQHDEHTHSGDPRVTPRPDLEARVYLLNTEGGLPPKVLRHRLRCIKRLRSRVVLDAGVASFRIVVFKEDPTPAPHPAASASPEENMPAAVEAVLKDCDGPHGTGVRSGDEVDRKATDGGTQAGLHQEERQLGKTAYQRQSARERQRNRRREARLKTRMEKLTGSPCRCWANYPVSERPCAYCILNTPMKDTIVILDSPGDTYDFWMMVILSLLYDETGQRRDLVPENADQILNGREGAPVLSHMQRYLDFKSVSLNGVDEMEDYMRVKKSEIASLERLQHNMTNPEWVKRQQDRTQFPMDHLVTILRHVALALPEVIRDANRVVRELKAGLREEPVRLKRWETILGISKEKRALERERHLLAMWYDGVVPLSGTAFELVDRWTAVKRKLRQSKALLAEAFSSCAGVGSF
jgi:hypothetical protein